MCDGIASGIEAEPVNEGKGVGRGGALEGVGLIL